MKTKMYISPHLKKLTICVICCSIISIYSCNKKTEKDDSRVTSVGESKFISSSQVFLKQLLENSSSSNNLNKTGSKSVINRLRDLNKKIDWTQAFEYKKENKKYLFVPTNETITPLSNKTYEFFRYLIFEKTSGTNINFSIVEYLSAKTIHIQENKKDLVILAFQNLNSENPRSIKNTNATIFFFNQFYKPTLSFELKNGLWFKSKKTFRSDLNITEN